MDIFDWLTGSENSQDTSSKIVKDESVESTQLKNQIGGVSKQTGSVADVLQTERQLGAKTETTLTDFLNQLVGGAGVKDTSAVDLAKIAGTRAKGADASIQAMIDSIIAAARSEGELDLGRRETAAARGAGSSLNSIVQQLGIEGRGDLETKLAGLAGQLGLQGRAAGTTEFASAGEGLRKSIEGLSTGVGAEASGIADIADILKGGTKTLTSSTEQQTTEQQVNQLVEALSQLTKGSTVQTTDGSTSQTSSGSILDIFKALKPRGLGQ